MMDHMTEVSGLSWPRRILNTLQNDDRLLAGGAAFLGGLMTAMGRITGEVAPFGVAYAAAAPRRMTVPALLGAALGYLLMAAPPAAGQYPLAALRAVGLRQLLAVITHKARPWQNVIGVLIGLTAAVILPGAYRHPLVYDVLLWMTSLLMAGAAAVFLQRGLALLEPDRKTPRERTLTASLALAAALCLMGLCSISAAGVSLGRVAASVLLLIAAAGAGSRAGTLIGVICGLVVGFSTGEFTLSITCFSVGGLLCGLFAPLGRLGSVLALAISYGFFAMLASRSVTGFLEVLLAAGIFWLLPAAVPRRAGQLIAPGREQKIAPLILSDRLEAAATALREVSSTIREVADHLQKSTAENPEMLFDRLANRYCKGCLYQMICWQQHYGDTVEALGRGLSAYRKENHIPAETLAGLNDRCPSRERLAAALEKGQQKKVLALCREALEQGRTPQEILSGGLIRGMNDLGEAFSANRAFVPEMLMAARCMTAALGELKPLMTGGNAKTVGRACIGTVRGDMHDIGKNLVKIMLEGSGVEVIDLGVDVTPEQFVETAKRQRCGVIACSSLLTTTMGEMRRVVTLAREAGIRDQVKIFVGGAPISQSFCDEIGADVYTEDAAAAARAAVSALKG